MEELWSEIPEHLRIQAKDVHLDPSQHDRIIFTATDNGKFHVKKYKALIRPQGNTRNWAKVIWHQTLPPNISAFMWKIIRHAVPVDTRIKTKGVVMASRCHCCQAYKEESLNHLFLHSEVARKVWTCFGNILKVPYMFGSITQATIVWMKIKDKDSQFDLCKISTCAYIFRKYGSHVVGLDMMVRR